MIFNSTKIKLKETFQKDDVERIESLLFDDDSLKNYIIRMNQLEPAEDIILKSNIPLISYCIYYGAVKCLKYLIKKGANLYVNDNFNRSPLFFAAANGNLELFNILSEYDLDMHQRDNNNLTILHYAAKYGSYDILCHLWLLVSDIEDDALDYRYYGKMTPLHLACESDSTETINFLIDNAGGLDIVDKNGQLPIHHAYRNKEVIELLIERGSDFRAVDNMGKTVFHYACERASEETASYVLDKLISYQFDCKSFFFSSVKSNNINMIKAFFKKGINPNYEDEYKRTGLHYSAMFGYMEMMAMFLDNNADIDWQDPNGNSALHYAYEKGRRNVIDYLESRGANKELKNYNNKVPKDLANVTK